MKRSLVSVITSAALVFSLTSCLAVKRVEESLTEREDAGFVPNLPDVPMPAHFVADADTSSFFDSAEGRIAEVSAEGFGTESEISDFYRDTMPQFGWMRVDKLAYKKQGELLVIAVEKGKTLSTIKYQLRPSI